MESSRIVVVEPPAFAGGPLRILNRCLQALAEAAARTARSPRSSWRAVLCFDEERLRQKDRRLYLLNEAGDPVVLNAPENGRLSAEERGYLAAAVLDTLPATAAGRAVIERLLPQPDADPLEAECRLWRQLLGPDGLEVIASPRELERPPEAVLEDGPWPAAEVIAGRPVTWFGPRHLAFLTQIGLAPRRALEGEQALRAALTPREGGGTLGMAHDLDAELKRALAAIEERVEQDDPELFGAVARLRRDLRRALRQFLRNAERTARNRSGIRGARLHRLAQGLRPADLPQEDRLSLLTAAALFELDLGRLADSVAAFAPEGGAEPLRIAAATGKSLSD